jgi:hypothetical protein
VRCSDGTPHPNTKGSDWLQGTEGCLWRREVFRVPGPADERPVSRLLECFLPSAPRCCRRDVVVQLHHFHNFTQFSLLISSSFPQPQKIPPTHKTSSEQAHLQPSPQHSLWLEETNLLSLLLVGETILLRNHEVLFA